MPQAHGIREVAYVDCKGGGQIEVTDGIAYVGHTLGKEATTIIDVKDPKSSVRWTAHITMFTRTRFASPTA